MSVLAIQANDLHRAYKQREAVKGISFNVAHGEIFGLLGHNGAGKTTTIRMLTGQIDPSSGTASVAGFDVVRDRQRLKEQIGVVFEDQNLYDRLSGRRNLEFSCWLYNVPTKRVDEVLDLVNLRDRAKDPVSAYSNGMRQRLMIARALLHRPQVLFLDEPSRGLDPIAAQNVRTTVARMAQEGMTVLLTTHLMEEADQLCQHVAFIANGQLVANDTPQHLKIQHGERILDVTVRGQSDPLHFRLDDATDQASFSRLLQQGEIETVHSREATLEEVFIKLAGVRLIDPTQDESLQPKK